MSLEACSTIQGFFRPQPKTRTETPAATKKNASESNEERAKEPAVKKHPPPPVTDSDKTDKPVGADDPFRKHDHSKYVAKVKKSATDFMNGLTDVTVARLCKDPYSDQWSLSLYFLDVKDYRFEGYAWDEIDEEWRLTYKSGKKPLAHWKKHVDISAAGKECTVLKGAAKLQ